MTRPLPCPFCGKATVETVDATRILGTWRIVHRCVVVGHISIEGVSSDDVVDRWNRRAPKEAKNATRG